MKNISITHDIDSKAAEKMARLYDEIIKTNETNIPEYTHALNVFLSRLLFCYFAEDTGIFDDNIFTNSIKSHTQEDGSDLQQYIGRLFEVLNQEKRQNIPHYLNKFPYIDMNIFKDKLQIPSFTKKSRRILIECGDLGWSEINPDIFGSMIQAVIDPEQRSGLGMHYTSVPNIMKVIEPLFLNDLYDDFEKSKNSPKKLKKLLARLSNLKIFDPACGSGNFLIIAYKKIRTLEIEILKILSQKQMHGFSTIKLSQFYGIEIDDLAHEVAILSLWLAEHQMNMKFKEVFGTSNPTLPLKESGNIVRGNATRLDWEKVCPKEEGDEIYILGNPPYLGARNQNTEQKKDMILVFQGRKEYKDTDYVACWFIKGAEYIKKLNSKYSFVTTNSICQGEQVNYLWPHIFSLNLEIGFAHSFFKWTNNAKGNAGVTVAIVGVRNISQNIKYLYTNNNIIKTTNITPYLTLYKNTTILPSKNQLQDLPKMVMGNMARDGGNLILNKDDVDSLLNIDSRIQQLIKPFLGSIEFIQGKKRWCLWIEDEQLPLANNIKEIKERIRKVYNFRIASKAKTTNGYASIPHKLAQRSHKKGFSIIIPRVSSERRIYIPFGFLDDNCIISDSAMVIYNAEPWIFGVISSKMHMIWVNTVAGRLETRIRYSSTLAYNTFPFPNITEKQKERITEHVYNVLDEREKHSEKTLAELYNPDKMPQGLRDAHHYLDLVIEKCYRNKPFESDEERLEHLFKLYEEMVNREEKQEPVIPITQNKLF